MGDPQMVYIQEHPFFQMVTTSSTTILGNLHVTQPKTMDSTVKNGSSSDAVSDSSFAKSAAMAFAIVILDRVSSS